MALALVAWVAISGMAHHPDYLSYFNELGGDHPERIVVDSDLDWGQNIVRLSRRLKDLNATQVAFTDFNLRPKNLMYWPGLPPVQEINPLRPTVGWSAVGVGVEKVGTLWLYNLSPEDVQRYRLGQ